MPTIAQPLVKQRIQSIDILRGVIMLIMALDHTRDFFHNAGPFGDPTNMATTTPIFFFTRWITHFCAPNFVFLSGISAYIAGTRRTKGELSAFLITRGLWIILVELVLMSLVFSANPQYNVIILQVLWAIGVSMIILSLVIRLPLAVIGIVGGLIFFSHDILDYLNLPKSGPAYVLESFFLTAKFNIIPLNQSHVIVDIYAILPWAGVMMLGYVFGSLYTSSSDPEKRKKILLGVGLAAVGMFIILRFFNIYGDPAPWSAQRNGVITFLSFLNVSKYPPSLLYCLMTIGVGIVVLALTENVRGKLAAIFIVYGNVPFFYYVLHFYLLRFLTIIAFFALGFHTNQIVTPNQPFLFHPPGYGFNLGGVYLVWLFVIIALYFPCRWFSSYKKTHKQWWVSYL